ncbi:MAG: glutamate--tRNA ligase [Candidatus Sungbacteria bacterium]|nr:glutamate--tRNA ligase [Candidatus Sungbacteria bacterium]
MSNIRVRIAPSPTGNLHVGTARAALFNYLFAKHHGGTFILRIEDTDLERSDKKYEQNIFEGLQWLGIDPDEGPEQGGLYGPYRQTERTAKYEEYIQRLLDAGKAFYCFHGEGEMRETQPAAYAPHRCDEYRNLTHDEGQAIKEAKDKEYGKNTGQYVIRFKTPIGEKIMFTDMVREELSFDSNLLGDFAIAKDTTIPLYHLAVVVDDIEMKISHVIRGEDHIPNTPKHVLLFRAFGVEPPHFAHLPLILGPDRSKLSKRHGAMSVTDYREQGYLPEALFNFLALLGWNPGDDREILTKDELIAAFSLEKVQKSGAIFDFQKLDWMNGEYIRRKPLSELAELATPFLEKSGLLQFSIFNFQFSKKEYIERIIALEQSRLKKLSEIGERVEYFFKPPVYAKELLHWKNMGDAELLASLERAEKIIGELEQDSSREVIEKTFLDAIGEGDKGSLLWPLRVALSGKKASPGPFEIMAILGIEESLKRIKAAQAALTVD